MISYVNIAYVYTRYLKKTCLTDCVYYDLK